MRNHVSSIAIVYMFRYDNMLNDLAHVPLIHRAGAPQRRLIHIHQLLKIQCTCFELDSVSINWWICINVCLVGADALLGQRPRGLHAPVLGHGEREGRQSIILMIILTVNNST